MKTSSLFLRSLAAVLLSAALLLPMGGCTTTRPVRSSTKQPSSTGASAVGSRQSQISQILSLNAAGKLTDEETTRLLRELTGAPSPAAAPTVAVTPAPAAPVAAPAPIVPAAVVAPAPVQPVRETNAQGLLVYKPEFNLTGRIRSVGSDTLDKLIALWEAKFREYHPSLSMKHEGKGSSTAIPALIEGRSDVGPMSRAVKPEEVEKFREKYGYAPLQVKVALDALAIYVHPENPILKKGLTLAQLDAIFSTTRLQGEAQEINTWGQLGLTGEWANAPITVYSRNKASGTYGFFKDTVLKGGEFKSTNNELVGSAEVVEAVGKDKFAIGYSGIGYITAAVRATPVAKDSTRPFISANKETALKGEYPLARFLYLTLNHSQSKSADISVVEFVRFILSAEGQALVAKDGYYSLPQRLLDEEMAKLN
ncbi:MAG: phosphate ABC transporter substrate-binding protein [Verrucomicrobiota bacterium]|nr:phosphate ABC transporter substrate-binding protein [Verrucomicrobiota bacterium]